MGELKLRKAFIVLYDDINVLLINILSLFLLMVLLRKDINPTNGFLYIISLIFVYLWIFISSFSRDRIKKSKFIVWWNLAFKILLKCLSLLLEFFFLFFLHDRNMLNFYNFLLIIHFVILLKWGIINILGLIWSIVLIFGCYRQSVSAMNPLTIFRSNYFGYIGWCFF